MAKGSSGGKLSLVSPSCPSSLLCLGPALSVFLALSFSVSLSPLFVNVIQCVVLCLSLLKNSPLSYHFCFFFSFSSSILLISACHLFLSAFLSTMRLVYLLPFNLLCYPAALHLLIAFIIMHPFFFSVQLQLFFSVISQFVSQFELFPSFPHLFLWSFHFAAKELPTSA